jgi:hypothetical protein
MAIIVEDGTIVENANSYLSIADARSFALSFGVTLSAIDSEVEAQLLQAMQWLKGKNYKGSRVSIDQVLDWPRKNVYMYGFEVPEIKIPQDLKDAQAQLVIEIHNGVSILPTVTERQVKFKKTGPLEKEYFGSSVTGPSNNNPVLPIVERYMLELLINNGYIRVLRV